MLRRYTLKIALEWDDKGECAGTALAGMLDRVVSKEINGSSDDVYGSVTIVGYGAKLIRTQHAITTTKTVWAPGRGDE